jgi:hypothetical protein
MRTIHVVVDFDAHKAGDHIEVDDQVACDAIAQGFAVPSVEVLEKALDPVAENRALDGAPEVK